MEATSENAEELRGLLLSMGRTIGGAGVDLLKASVLALAQSAELELRPVGRYWSAALGAALQMIREPESDLRPLGMAVHRYYALGLDAWLTAQAKSASRAVAPPTNSLGIRAARADEAIARPEARHPLSELVVELCRAGSRLVRGDEGAEREMRVAAERIGALLVKGQES